MRRKEGKIAIWDLQMFCFSAAEEIDHFLQISLLCFISVCSPPFLLTGHTQEGYYHQSHSFQFPHWFLWRRCIGLASQDEQFSTGSIHFLAFVRLATRSPVYTCQASSFRSCSSVSASRSIVATKGKSFCTSEWNSHFQEWYFYLCFLRLVNTGLTICSSYFLFFNFWLISAVLASCTNIWKLQIIYLLILLKLEFADFFCFNSPCCFGMFFRKKKGKLLIFVIIILESAHVFSCTNHVHYVVRI